jgi:hypothetical protein
VSWRGLRYKGTEILRSTEWNVAVDALNDLYGWLTDGTKDIRVNNVYAKFAEFSTRPVAEGRPVILDGDPITIYQFYDLAKQQISEAIDRSSNVSYIAEAVDYYLPRLATIEEYVRGARDVLVKIKIDEYGNVGVRIAEPLDEYGRVVVSPPSELLDEFMPVSAYGSITATDNTAGFSVTLSKGGRPNVNIYYNLGGAGTIYLKVSIDGVTWRTLKTYTLAEAGEGIDIIQGIAYPYVRLETPTTGIDVVFEIVASR